MHLQMANAEFVALNALV